MKISFLRATTLLLFSVVLCSCATLTPNESSLIGHNITRKQYDQLSAGGLKLHQLALSVCKVVYPPDGGISDCMSKMVAMIDVYIPEAEKNAKLPPFPEFSDPEKFARIRPEVIEMVTRYYGTCKNANDITKCADDFYSSMLSGFDQHTRYIPAQMLTEEKKMYSGTYAGIGAPFRFESGGKYIIHKPPLSGSPAEKAGLREGDEIVSINAIPSTKLRSTKEVVGLERGPEGSQVTFMLRHKDNNDVYTAQMTREILADPFVSSVLIPHKGKVYGYLHIRMFGSGVADQLEREVRAMLERPEGRPEGLIISVQGNRGGLLKEADKSLRLFLQEKYFVLTRDADGLDVYVPSVDPAHPLHYGDITRGMPILVVVNEESASASEIFAKALKHFARAVIAGTGTTFKKGLVQSKVDLGDKTGFDVTIAEYVVGTRNDWEPVQCVGVNPDLLFLYPGTVPKGLAVTRKDECDHLRKIVSLGPMDNAPKRPDIELLRPELYLESKSMLEAYLEYLHLGVNE